MPDSFEKRTVSFYFYNVLIRFYLPLEAKYVGLFGKKDKILIQELIHYYFEKIFPRHNDTITSDDFFENYIVDMNRIFEKVMSHYIALLFELAKQNKLRIENKEIKALIRAKKYDKVIEIIEKTLGIPQTEVYNQLINSEIHVNDNIYKKDMDNISTYLRYFSEAYKLIGKKVSVLHVLTKQPNKYSRLEYIFFVASHELLSFLSHYSTAVVFFSAPGVFIGNLHKGSAHLKRALMDIYDGLIVEEEMFFSTEYLLLRSKKVNSLGHNEKMEDVVIGLKKYFEKNQSSN